MSPHKVRLILAYDGSEFQGWQRQNSGVPTVQGSVEKALSQIFDTPVSVVGTSRTDAGVHARYQVAHFLAPRDPRPYKLIRGLNALLPSSVVLRRADLVAGEFHAIASATGKTYRYKIWNHRLRDPGRVRYLTHVDRPLDVSRLNLLAREIIGEHDFRSFQTSGSAPASTRRKISHALWVRRSATRVDFEISGSGFLKQMVRNIVGTCLDLHFRNAPAAQMRRILAAQNRSAALGTASPQGLYLWHVQYPKDLDSRCLKI